MSEIKMASDAEQARLEALAAPMIDYLTHIEPREALCVLVAVTSMFFLMVKHKPGVGPLNTLDDHFVPAVRKTIEQGFALLADDSASMPEANRHD